MQAHAKEGAASCEAARLRLEMSEQDAELAALREMAGHAKVCKCHNLSPNPCDLPLRHAYLTRAVLCATEQLRVVVSGNISHVPLSHSKHQPIWLIFCKLSNVTTALSA